MNKTGGRRVFAALIAVVMFFSVFSAVSLTAAKAETTETKYSPTRIGTATEAVYLRGGASMNTYPVATIYGGDTVNVYSKILSEGRTWYKTTYGGQWAYVPAEYMTVPGGDDPPPLPEPDSVTPYSPAKDGVVNAEVNVRTGWSTEAPVKGTLPTGTNIKVYALVKAKGSAWYKTTYGGQW
ncbi:MAG: hypothetical protein RR472_06550, partial [Anaerovoracaceae bacterium]